MFRVAVYVRLVCCLAFAAMAPAYADNSTPPAGLGFVIGQGEQLVLPTPTAGENAGLIAAALARKGFAVTAAGNLDSALLKSAIADFVTVARSAPTLPIIVYLGGPIVQSGQNNYLVPANLATLTQSELQANAISITALISDLSQATSGPKLFLIDGTRIPKTTSNPIILTSGLAIPKRIPNTSVILNHTPGMTGKDEDDLYHPFALSVSEAINTGLNSPRNFASLVTLRTFELSKGRQVPWAWTQDERAGNLFSGEPTTRFEFQDLNTKQLSTLDEKQGFAAAMLRGTVLSYEEYNLLHIQNPMTPITRALLASLRDSQVWQEVNTAPSASGFWAYLARYPRGLYADEARAQLAALNKSATPSVDDALQSFTTSPPAHDELVMLSQITPYHIDETSTDLVAGTNVIKATLPPMADALRNPAKPLARQSLYALPLPSLEAAEADRIKLPASVPNQPIIVLPPEPAGAKKPKKTGIPLPPQRQSNDVKSDPPEEPALFTITIPMPSGAQEQPAPKPKATKSTGDVFEQIFNAPPAQQNLPY